MVVSLIWRKGFLCLILQEKNCLSLNGLSFKDRKSGFRMLVFGFCLNRYCS